MTNAKFEEQIKNLGATFDRDGYAVVKNFLSDEEVDELRNEALRLIREESRGKDMQVFGNDFNIKSKYYMESSGKIHYFFEENAVNKETGELQLPEEQSLAKIAHGLHALNPIYKQLSTHDRVKEVFKAIGYVGPTIVQSMVIFKNPKVGGEYIPHQDASYMYSDPPYLAGVWYALDDATAENGCLEFIPGSHKGEVTRRLVRTGNTKDGEELLKWTAPVDQYDDDKFVKVPVKRGDMILIHGLVVHRSAANQSDKSRWIYTFHAYDRERGIYSDKNWLQNGEVDTFVKVY